MEQIDGEEDSVLTWGDLCRLNVQKSADAVVRKLLQQSAEGLNMK
jgi:hypothetical protein